MTLPNDYARCAGAELSECSNCQRRVSAGPVQMQPPSIVAGWCEYHIPMELSDDD